MLNDSDKNIPFEELQKLLGERVVFLRKEKGILQKDLADMMEVDDSTVRRIEKGQLNLTLKTIDNLCKSLDITLIELFSFKTTDKEII
ncbi:helix-turn-helix domain-containing protein [Plebeiibacterium sediminum]|uniref:Helix-turn-helix domain-containing protein n=1 Tax=Plebeiibacterium sediminum TaxID=2992112 RepID=A0AAE3MAA1_9BACT|nr:helix-turn-helix transcriptional regulator [Plebeiobacterium sediminum]MCW3789355.1 helix-turn-helix domain-containing protein [Plebeiobacterium sediminum]